MLSPLIHLAPPGRPVIISAAERVEPKDLHGGRVMSMTLNLADRLLAMGRNFQAIGRDRDALHILGRLSDFRQISADVSEESQHRQAEILLRSGRYVRAR